MKTPWHSSFKKWTLLFVFRLRVPRSRNTYRLSAQQSAAARREGGGGVLCKFWVGGLKTLDTNFLKRQIRNYTQDGLTAAMNADFNTSRIPGFCGRIFIWFPDGFSESIRIRDKCLLRLWSKQVLYQGVKFKHFRTACSQESKGILTSRTPFFFYKNVVFPVHAEYSYFSADFRLKIFSYCS